MREDTFQWRSCNYREYQPTRLNDYYAYSATQFDSQETQEAEQQTQCYALMGN